MGDIALGIGLQGMLSAQAALDTIGHNLANANTPGYSRQRLTLNAQRPLRMANAIIGRGVRTDGTQRISDNVLNRRIVGQTAIAARLDAGVLALSGVEAMLGGVGGTGLGALMDGFFESVSELAGDPSDVVRRNGMVQSAGSLATQFHQLADSTQGLRADALEQVEALVSQVNSLATQIRDLNAEIATSEAGGLMANDLRDQRDVAFQQLAELIDVQYSETNSGSATLTVGGHLLAGQNLVHELHVEYDEDGQVELYVGDTTSPVDIGGGQIGGLLEFVQDFLPQFDERVDALARNMILEVNRAHSTGTPAAGGFTSLTSAYALDDFDSDGQYADQLIAQSGLPFDLQDGQLQVNVTNPETGSVQAHTLDVDASTMSVGDLLDALNGIDHLNASITPDGRLQVRAENGRLFDFSNRVDGDPDELGTFGGGRASLASAGAEPFALADGMTLSFSGSSGPFTVTLDGADFENVSNASAAEVVAALNQDPGFAANGMRVTEVDGHLVVQSSAPGSGQSFDVTGGTALAALGLPTGTFTGSDVAAQVQLSGTYTGDANQELTFRPLADGQIGSTPGLQVEVRNQAGALVAVLDVGEDYVPGTPLEVGDGLSVEFTVGELSATDQDFFVAHATADSDTADLLAAFGMNAFFEGSDAQSIEVVGRLVDDPTLIAASTTGGAGGNGALLDILKLQSGHVEGLNSGFSQYFGDVVGDVGFELDTKQRGAETERYLVDSLKQRRDQISGVSVDEELVDMIRFEQAFAASARFIQVVQQVSDTVLNLV